MPEVHGYLKALLGNLKRLREHAGLTESRLEERLILGPGWIGRFERGETVPSIDMVLAILHATNSNLAELLRGLPEPEAAAVERVIFAEKAGTDTCIHFDYAEHDAQYMLPNSSLVEYGTVIKTLRDGLAQLAITANCLWCNWPFSNLECTKL
jgi:transcriptional regulator with XRE-family HTH domain